jgi:IS1 family transposase
VQGRGNIRAHAPKDSRWRCTICRHTFVATRGTVFYRKHTAVELMVIVLTLITNGCPVAAIVAAFGLQARTISSWLEQSGQHAEALQEHLVEQPLDHRQVQADEIRCKTQAGIVWMAMAMAVPTRLWLGGRVSLHRNRQLIASLCQLIARCCVVAPLLVAVDGLVAYVKATIAALRLKAERTGRRGRSRLVERGGLLIGQVVKQRCKRRLVGIIRRVAYGDEGQLAAQLAHSQVGGGLNTSYIERLNATFRVRLAVLARRSRRSCRKVLRLHRAMYLVGAVYNFCTPHQSLRELQQPRTPAMAAGLSDHVWDVKELLSYRIPPPKWQKRGRGKPSRQLQAMLTRWEALSRLSAYLPRRVALALFRISCRLRRRLDRHALQPDAAGLAQRRLDRLGLLVG